MFHSISASVSQTCTNAGIYVPKGNCYSSHNLLLSSYPGLCPGWSTLGTGAGVPKGEKAEREPNDSFGYFITFPSLPFLKVSLKSAETWAHLEAHRGGQRSAESGNKGCFAYTRQTRDTVVGFNLDLDDFSSIVPWLLVLHPELIRLNVVVSSLLCPPQRAPHFAFWFWHWCFGCLL